nr:DUF917 family protein [Salinicoccus albus]
MNAIDGIWTEIIARAATMTMGGSLAERYLPDTGSQVKNSSIIGSLSLEESMGDIIINSKTPIKNLKEKLNGHILFNGKL